MAVSYSFFEVFLVVHPKTYHPAAPGSGTATSKSTTGTTSGTKFDTINEAAEKARIVFTDYEHHAAAQHGYVEVIRAQRDTFRSEVEQLLWFA
jgi:hypothetical protein